MNVGTTEEIDEEIARQIVEIYWNNYHEVFEESEEKLKKLDKKIWGKKYPFLSPENLINSIKNGDYRIIIYKEENKVIGFAFYKENKHIYLDEIHVRKEYRGKGIGKLLLMELMKKGKRIIAEVHQKSLEFFIKMGFKVKGEFRGYLSTMWYIIEWNPE